VRAIVLGALRALAAEVLLLCVVGPLRGAVAAECSLTIQLVDRAGQGIAGLDVDVGFFPRRTSRNPNPPALAWRRASSDGRGEIDLAPPGEAVRAEVDVLPGPSRLPLSFEVSARDVGTGSRWPTTRRRVWDRGRIGGIVLGPDRRPAIGAGVDVRWHRVPRERWSGRTDGRGRFVVAVPADATLSLEARKTIGERVYAANATGVASGEMGLVMRTEHAHALAVTFVDDRGDPLPRRPTPEAWSEWGTEVPWEACGPEPGVYRVRCDEEIEGEPWHGGATVSVPTPDGTELRLRPTSTLVGHIRDALAIRHTIASVDACGRCDPYVDEADADGRFEIRVPSDWLGLDVSAPDDDRYAWIERSEAARGPLSVALQHGESITGRITSPAPDSSTMVLRAVRGPVLRQGVIEPDGTFRITGLPPGTYSVMLECDGERWIRRGVLSNARGLALSPPP
jgi:hypothetical protein